MRNVAYMAGESPPSAAPNPFRSVGGYLKWCRSRSEFAVTRLRYSFGNIGTLTVKATIRM